MAASSKKFNTPKYEKIVVLGFRYGSPEYRMMFAELKPLQHCHSRKQVFCGRPVAMRS